MTIEMYPTARLIEWLMELQGYFQLPGIPFNYYEIAAELDRREKESK